MDQNCGLKIHNDPPNVFIVLLHLNTIYFYHEVPRAVDHTTKVPKQFVLTLPLLKHKLEQ